MKSSAKTDIFRLRTSAGRLRIQRPDATRYLNPPFTRMVPIMVEPVEPYVAKERFVGPYRFDIHISDRLAQEWYGYPDQWQIERQWWIDIIKPGSTILECGAHQGLTTMLLALCTGPTGIVHAWEASPRNAALIGRNAELNGLRNVVVHPNAVSDRKAILPILDNMGAFVILEADDPRVTGIVEAVRLDDDYDHSRKVDLLKIDVDGAELEVMRGASRILACRPHINIEVHNYLFADPAVTNAAILDMVRPLGYRFKAYVYDDGDIVDLNEASDVAWLTGFKFFQLFCTPV
jgi:FkbM family methyltransferase